MVAMADAFLRLRVDSSQVKKDAESGLDKVDAKGAGQKAGASFGEGFYRGADGKLRDSAGKFLPESDFVKVGGKTGTSFGTSFGTQLKASIAKSLRGFSVGNLLTGDSKDTKGASAAGQVLNRGGIVGGALPGIPGISGLVATVAGIGASLVAALPAVAAIGAGFVGVAGSVGVIVAGVKTLIGTKDAMGPLYQQAQQISETFHKTIETAAGTMLTPLKTAFAQIPGIIKSLQPAISGAFAGAGTLIAPLLSGLTQLAQTVLPLLGSMFRATAPLIQPLFNGLSGLVGGILPPLIGLIRAAQPAFSAFAGILITLGSSLGGMLSAFTPVIGASSSILTTLFNVLSELLPIIGQLAGQFATALVPIFRDFGDAIQVILPFLVQVGSVIASFAGAVLTDLTAVFRSLIGFVIQLAPSLTILTRALTNVFNILENSGVFAILADAIEQVLPLFAQLINALVIGLAPALPVLVQAVAQLGQILVQLLAAGLTQVLQALIPVVSLLASSASSLVLWLDNAGLLVPVLTALLVIWKGWAVAMGAARIAMALVTAATKAWTVAQAALDVVLSANPIALIVIAIAALAAAFVLLWQHSAGFRTAIKDIGAVILEMGIIAVQGIKILVDAFLNMISIVLHGAASAFGWIPGIGGKLQGAAAAFDSFKNGVNNTFDSMVGKMKGWQGQLLAQQQTVAQTSAPIIAAFQAQQAAATAASNGINALSTAITQNGASSTQAAAARTALINDMTKAGVSATQAKTDVDLYSSAVAANGTSSQAAQGARAQLVQDILGASTNARQGKDDLEAYNTAVINNGASSSAAQGARATLISDLEKAGVSAQNATSLVDGLTGALNKIPTTIAVQIQISEALTNQVAVGGATNAIRNAASQGFAAGGYIGGAGTATSDSIPVMASNGEFMMNAKSVAAYGVGFMHAVNSQKLSRGGSVRRLADGGYVTAAVGLGSSRYRTSVGESSDPGVLLSRKLDQVIDAIDNLTRTTASVPAGVGKHVGGALNQTAADASFTARYGRGGGW